MTPAKPESGPRNCVAIIDDDEDLRLLLRHSLELRGFSVLEFETTEDALGWETAEKTGAEPPLSEATLLLLDVNLPGISGIETIELIKNTPALRHLAIAMLSAHGEVDVVLRCIKAGANDYFVKPLDLPEVMRRIDKLVHDPSGILQKSGQAQVSWNFQEFLVRELKRAERSEEPLGLLLGAVRKLNQASDSLQPDEIASLWRQPSSENTPPRALTESFIESVRRRLREYDLIVPFGMAEFAVILPDTLPAGTQTVVRKLHAVFQSESPFPPLPRQERWAMLVGGANYPDEGRDRLTLFSTAERNLTEDIPEKPKLSSDKDLVFLKTVRCHSCGRHFSYPKVAVRRLTPIARDSDFRMVFEDLDPLLYGAVACPHCGFSVLEMDLKSVRHLEPPVFRWQYRSIEPGENFLHPSQTIVPEELSEHLAPSWEAWMEEKTVEIPLHEIPETIDSRKTLLTESRRRRGETELMTLESALANHLLARQVYDRLGASPLRRARLAHRIAWLHRIADNKEDESKLLGEALDFYKTAFHFEDLTHSKPSELEILFLLGELSFRIDRENDAVAIFEHLVRDPRVEERESFKKMIHRRWYEARNEPLP
ncbi:MAG: DUF2225 domain-containing protein [Candidatus Omnitrophica bacterium]|nr:DUF2225 domain-containing protein [Candidatus Omnitrophota bacterium]